MVRLKNHNKLFSVILILAVGIIVYSNTFHCSFHFDDFRFVTLNPYIKNIFNLHNIWHYWYCRFVTFFSLALNYHFNGLDVFGYHIFNLSVHLGAALLVWWLVLLTLSTPVMKADKIARHADVIALMAGLIFVSHPIQTEAVTNIWQRAASMAALFYLASLCLYVKSRLTQDKRYYIGALITTVLAMFTKENTVTLPLMIVLYEFSFFSNGPLRKMLGDAKCWKPAIPFLFTIFIIPITFLLSTSEVFQDHHGGLESHGVIITPINYFLTEIRVMFTYIRLAFVPFNQNFDRDYPLYNSIFDWPVFISLLSLVAIFYFTKRLFTKYRMLSFGIYWFFLTLIIPESSFWAMGDVILEYRLYLPLVGYSIFLVSAIYYLLDFLVSLRAKRSNLLPRSFVVLLILIVACNAVLTYQRNKVWKNELTLWDDVVKKSPDKSRAYNNLGNAYLKIGYVALGITNFERAIELNPKAAKAYIDMGCAYGAGDNLPQAIYDFKKALEINPNNPDAYYNLGFFEGKQGHTADAILDFTKAIKLNPLYAEAYFNRGLIWLKQGDETQAIADFSKTIDIDPKNPQAYYNLGLSYSNKGDAAQAIVNFTRAIAVDPLYAGAYNNRGCIYGAQKNYDQAIADFTKAIEIDPHFTDAYNNRAFIYSELKK